MRRVLAVGLLVAVASAFALEVKLTPDEEAVCEAEGGCVVMSRKLVQMLMMQAHQAGAARCEKSL